MNKLLEKAESLRSRMAEIDARQAEIEKECDDNHDGAFTDELKTEYSELGEEYLKAQTDLTDVEDQIKARKAREARANTPVRPTRPEASTPRETPVWESDNPKIAVPATCKSHTVRHFSGEEDGRSAEERAYRFGMFMLARASVDLPNRYHFQEAIDFAQDQWAVLSSNDSNGSRFRVPHEFGTDMIRLIESYGVARRLLKIRPMSTETRSDPRRTGGLTAYAVGDNDAGTESDMTLDQVNLVAKEWMVLTRYSRNLSADEALSLGDDLAFEIAYAFAQKEDQAAFNGDGTSTYHGITGIRTKLQDVDGGGTDSAGLVTGSGNAYSELTLADFHNVAAKLPDYADNPGTTWVMHRSFFHEVPLKLELASGGVPAREIMDGDRRPRPTFLGYPVQFSNAYPKTGGNSQVCATLGDYSLGASLGDRRDTMIEFSDSATVGGQSMWERNQIGVKGTNRWDINVHDVGDASNAGPIVGLQTAAS